MDLPIVEQQRRLFRQIFMLDKTASVGIAFYAVIFDERNSIPERLAEFVPRI